jgi:hypothetical protein
MNAIPRSIDTSSKRWLTILAVTAAASVIFVAYSVVKALSPPEPSVVAPQKPTPAPIEEAVTRSEPDWNSAAAGHVAEDSQAAATRADPFAAQYAAAAKNDPVAAQQAVHREAEYFRTLISQGKLPECYGKLTKEQVDQMEKKGVMIN